MTHLQRVQGAQRKSVGRRRICSTFAAAAATFPLMDRGLPDIATNAARASEEGMAGLRLGIFCRRMGRSASVTVVLTHRCCVSVARPGFAGVIPCPRQTALLRGRGGTLSSSQAATGGRRKGSRVVRELGWPTQWSAKTPVRPIIRKPDVWRWREPAEQRSGAASPTSFRLRHARRPRRSACGAEVVEAIGPVAAPGYL